MDGVSGQRSRRRTLPPRGVANMSLPHINDTTQRRASAVCELQDTSAVVTTVDTETFEPQNMVQYVLHDGGWMLSERVTSESLRQWRQRRIPECITVKKTCVRTSALASSDFNSQSLLL